jgi:hypothetical protein
MDKIDKLKAQIINGKFPTEFPHFGGANLIITNDPNRNGYEHDTIICSEHASTLSWLVIELKNIYNEEIDYMNKYEFYTNIGNLLNSCIKEGFNLDDSMIYVVEKVESEWGVK